MTNVHLAFRPKYNHFLILNHYIPKLCLNHSELFGKVLVRVCWWNRNWALRLPLVFLSFICLIFSKCSFHTFLVNTVWHSLILKKNVSSSSYEPLQTESFVWPLAVVTVYSKLFIYQSFFELFRLKNVLFLTSSS